jgi:hypothetical protein
MAPATTMHALPAFIDDSYHHHLLLAWAFLEQFLDSSMRQLSPWSQTMFLKQFLAGSGCRSEYMEPDDVAK